MKFSEKIESYKWELVILTYECWNIYILRYIRDIDKYNNY